MSSKNIALPVAVLLVFTLSAAPAYDGHTVTAGPLEVSIAAIGPVTRFDEPVAVRVALRNTGDAPIAARVRVDDLVDEWRVAGAAEKTVTVSPGTSAAARFGVAVGTGAHAALYPVHVYADFAINGRDRTAHAVRIVETRFADAAGSSPRPETLPAVAVPRGGSVGLASLDARVAWRRYEGNTVYLPVGWRGSAPDSRASFRVGSTSRGDLRRSLQMHPPWKGGGGTIFAAYRLRLPKDAPAELTFANAIRDSRENEPASDGVTFRVWVGEEKLFEKHTDAKQWVESRVDLSRFAGGEILLRIESHPGPRRSTTCDSSFWGAPVVAAGAGPDRADPAKTAARAAALLAGRVSPGDGEARFDLDGPCRAAVVCGNYGILDGAIAFAGGEGTVVFGGMDVSVEDSRLAGIPSLAAMRNCRMRKDASGAVVSHGFQLGGERRELLAAVRAAGPGLRIQVSCDARITDITTGPADRRARRVYFGHGYCVDRPEAFSLRAGGHRLSTSHVGFDFDGGLSVLAATDNPPKKLRVDPAASIYSLHTAMNTVFTFVPSPAGAIDCAVKYRGLYGRRSSAGFGRKAGRFVFDIWGGRYADIADDMAAMAAYGLTDALLVVHAWQRWGYDYRLPDIYPPNPDLGTVADVRRIAAVCGKNDIPWALHDNYIDFYPDAKGYTYDRICFAADGRPVKAWLNKGRQARSFRWRPDRIAPFYKRNLRLIKPNLGPTAYFIDVFSAIPCIDFYDRAGRFHSMLETRKHWGGAFDWIRDYLGGNAPMISEAGHDHLVGHLDGADCQHLRLVPRGRRFCITLPCEDWERTPWFDAVLHDRFSLHGVGYSGRYQGGRSRRAHGIESDDYISAEMLAGHPAMIDRRGMGRGAVRKYWLSQPFIRSIATDRIAAVTCDGGDIHRQVVRWESGAVVRVNRGTTDWKTGGVVLPRYGYAARSGKIASSIERIDGVIVERSSRPGGLYVNGRGFGQDTSLPIRPRLKGVRYLGDRKFRLEIEWEAARPAPKDLRIFLHFDSDRIEGRDRIAFQGDHTPRLPTGAWQGRVTTGTGRVITIPAQHGPGEYTITAGLYDPDGGKRQALPGPADRSGRCRLGTLVVEGTGGTIADIRAVALKTGDDEEPRWNVAGKPVDFGAAITSGAFRCERKGGTVVVTPLPGLDAFTVALRLDRLPGGRIEDVARVAAMDAEGTATGTVPHTVKDGLLTFETAAGVFAYRVTAAQE